MQSDSLNDKSNKQMDDILDYQTENDQDSLGVRDVLLIKCKSVIQDLHQEIADLNQENVYLQERAQQLEQQLEEKDKQIRQSIYQNENIVDEFQNERAQVQLLQEKNSELEKEIIEYKQNEEGILQQLDVLQATNNEMKQKVQELTQELEKRDHIAHEWNQTMQSVSLKIQELDRENQWLTSERNQMLLSLEKISPRNRFDLIKNAQQNQDRNQQNNILNEWLQQTVDNLQNAIRDNEKKNQLIDQLQKENLNLKSSNMRLQRALEQNQHQINLNQANNNTNIPKNRSSSNHQTNQDSKSINNSFNQSAQQQSNIPNTTQHQSNYEIQNLQLEIGQLKQDCEEKSIEIQKLQFENLKLKEKMNVLNRKYLNAEIDSRKIDSSMNNQLSSLEIDKNREVNKYKELIQEQKELIQQLQNNDYIVNQAKEIAKLQQTNEFLNQRLLDCKQELNDLQKDIFNQFEKEDQRSIMAQQKLKQLEQIIKEREDIIKSQEKDIEQMKQIINEQTFNANNPNKTVRERSNSTRQEKTEKEEIDNHDRTLLTLMNENKSLQALLDSLQTQLKNEKLTRIREQNSIQKMKAEVQNLEDQYNREINFYKTEFAKQLSEAYQQTGSSIVQNTINPMQTEQNIMTEIANSEIKQEKKQKKINKEKRATSGKDGKSEQKSTIKNKTQKKKEKKKVELNQNIITPSIILDRQQEQDHNQTGERINSTQNLQQGQKQYQTPQSTQRINYVQSNSKRNEYDLQSQTNQNNFNSIFQNATVRNQPQLGYYKTIQQPLQPNSLHQNQQQQIKPTEQNQEQVIDRFKQVNKNFIGKKNTFKQNQKYITGNQQDRKQARQINS
ncbi:hypothetical protein TTHERM_00143710 (macronuclear) [Tetrahymena thermophila SB210]|uniref:Uncharacterized protein n=1 Tax=Tetrahymena thermophila (strain SB210) TaxID=312017 RepID=I7MDS5_TETTS|nr:hypothetical protein TTHERM_00143710 [Tetrahymena thermophila SB210]EAR90865.2 hypothetical protein TTHERM_00143710 [Tetrahymena thermophila SB210]|eukprot:XP_001011110.2 hypothetical protein TTHERM_00143710 [Tetrahymena thermophila SB210]